MGIVNFHLLITRIHANTGLVRGNNMQIRISAVTFEMFMNML